MSKRICVQIFLCHIYDFFTLGRCRLSEFGFNIIVIAINFQLAFIYKLYVTVLALAFWLVFKFLFVFFHYQFNGTGSYSPDSFLTYISTS